MNAASIALLALLALGVAAAVIHIIKRRGSCSCGGNCCQCGGCREKDGAPRE